MADGIVFDEWQPRLADLDGETVTVLALDLDDFDADLIGSMRYVAEVVGWEVTGDEYVRETVALAGAIEDGSYVVRYVDSIAPELDLTGVGNVNAVAFYVPVGDDSDHLLIGAIRVEPGAGFAGWSPDEPDDGLFRVASNLDELLAALVASITGIDGGTSA